MEKKKGSIVSKHRIRYTEEFQHEVCLEYLTGRFTKAELQNKYGIKGKSRLFTWLKKFGYIAQNLIKPMSKSTSNINRSQQKKDKQNKLEDAQLKAEIYSKMIEIAEQEYKIKIRKNFNTK